MARMTGRKRKFSRRRYRSRKRFRRASAGVKALRMVRKMRRNTPRPETKHITHQNTSLSVPDTGVIQTHLSMASGQGDTTNSRTGDEIFTSSIVFNYSIGIDGSATNTAIRVMLLTDNSPAGQLPAIGDILHDPTLDDAIVSTLNHTNRRRFWPLYDRTHRLSSAGVKSVQVAWSTPFRRKIVYAGTAGDVTDLDKYNLIFFAVSTETTNTPAITSFCQVRYHDN